MKESGGQLRGDEMAKDAWGWIDITSMKTAARRGPQARARVHPARRRQRGRPDGGDGDAAGARAAGRVDHARHRVHVEAAAGVRAHRLQGRLLPGRPVVPEARRLRAGRHARARDGRLELPPVPRDLGVLRRLRQLRASTSPCRATTSSAPPASGQRERANGERHDHLHVRAGRRPRLRVDGRSRTTSWSRRRSRRRRT